MTLECHLKDLFIGAQQVSALAALVQNAGLVPSPDMGAHSHLGLRFQGGLVPPSGL